MGHHYEDGDTGQYDASAKYPTNAPGGFAAGSTVVRQRLGAAERDYGGAIRGTAPADKNKRGQIEAATEHLITQLQIVNATAERVHRTMLGYDPRPNKPDSSTLQETPSGIMAQQLLTLSALGQLALDTRLLLENIATEIGA